MKQDLTALRIEICGIVQGVGFRPFVYNLADRLNLTGWVRNTSSGVEIEINGESQAVQSFQQELQNHPPVLARIDTILITPIQPNNATRFEILTSQAQPGQFLPVSPDVSVCPDCQRELFDPKDRRYRYPFINCTNCGPRFTIVKDIPYDRPNTTMAGFPLCPDCRKEYENPHDRRFHAQPVACPVCGPHLTMIAGGRIVASHEDALHIARKYLKDGKILAIKGLGGYHLACDAANPAAVIELRKRKKRSDKPFALMVFDRAALEHHALITPEDWALLTSPAHPIVLFDKLTSSDVVPDAAPNQHTLGIMLPYTPLHLLLLEPAPGFPNIFVMTSGNLSEEPIAYDDEDAFTRLSPLADAFLLNNRPIQTRVDDSVVRTFHKQSYPIRRSRGYAPDPIFISREIPPLLAAGAELKNVFCHTRDHYAFLSHHIGDMENFETYQSFEEGIAHMERLFRIQPERIACDLHPNYLATRYAHQRSQQENIPLVEVQHHHAHLAACLADNQWDSLDPVIGLCLDGTGYGSDGSIWGGEVLVGGYSGFQRAFHMKYAPLAGGDICIRKPARMALCHLWSAGLDWEADLPPVKALCSEERLALHTQLEHQINSVATSSMGRFFDAASALIGLRSEATYEGQAAIELEAIADRDEINYYPVEIIGDLLDPAPLWQSMIMDWRSGISLPVLSARFHNSISRLLIQCCLILRERTSINQVALSGGVWQNMILLARTIDQLEHMGFKPLYHHRVPTNDGCIALGQAMIAGTMNI